MLEILYEDSSCLAVLKPAGISTQAPARIDSLERRVRDYLQQQTVAAAQSTDTIYLGLPHRLDRPVSGVIVFAKTRRAARIISRQLERRQVKKTYWTCIEGQVEPGEGTWSDFLRKVPNEPRVEIVSAAEPQAQQAILHYKTLRSLAAGGDKSVSRLEIELETGRMHQIRVQAASRGHPVVGDLQYGSASKFGPETVDPRERTIALHARSLTFWHPDTKEPVTVTAALPAAWIKLGIAVDSSTLDLRLAHDEE
jgi:RluA family pseudouridine synthase